MVVEGPLYLISTLSTHICSAASVQQVTRALAATLQERQRPHAVSGRDVTLAADTYTIHAVSRLLMVAIVAYSLHPRTVSMSLAAPGKRQITAMALGELLSPQIDVL